MRKIVAILAFILASGCATTTTAPDKNLNLIIKYAYYSQGQDKIDGHIESDLNLIFPSIPGEIFGNPSSNIIYSTSPNKNYTFSLKLPKKAENYSSKLKEKSLTIEPADTKIMRLGTFNYLPKYKNGIGGAGFKNISNGNFVVLVYFSKAANIAGELLSGTERYVHNIVVDKSGWHWIEITESEPGNFELTTYNGDLSNIEFSIFLLGAINA